MRRLKAGSKRKRESVDYFQWQIHSVGGTEYDRKSRDRLTKKIGFTNSTFESLQYAEKPWLIKPLNNWIEKIKEYETLPSENEGNLDISLSSGGTKKLVYLCGHYDPTRFNKVIIANKANIDFVGVMGPGFNYLDFGDPRPPPVGAGYNILGLWKDLKRQLGPKLKGFGFSGHAYFQLEPQKQPPSYSSVEVWDTQILPQYPAELQELRKYNVGGFWITRDPTLLKKDDGDGGSKVVTGAFIRQFELHSLIRGGQYARLEQKVVQKLVGVSDTQTLKAAIDSLSSPAAIKAKLAEEARLAGEDVADFFDAAVTSYLTQVMVAYSTWKSAYFDNKDTATQRSILQTVTKAVFDSIVELKPEFNIKEYDAAGLHDFLLQISDSSIEFSEDDHLKVLKHVLENKTIEEEGELKSRFNAMRTQLQDRTLHIIGDLGLDPQSDDYLCYALAAYLYKTLK